MRNQCIGVRSQCTVYLLWSHLKVSGLQTFTFQSFASRFHGGPSYMVCSKSIHDFLQFVYRKQRISKELPAVSCHREDHHDGWALSVGETVKNNDCHDCLDCRNLLNRYDIISDRQSSIVNVGITNKM